MHITIKTQRIRTLTMDPADAFHRLSAPSFRVAALPGL